MKALGVIINEVSRRQIAVCVTLLSLCEHPLVSHLEHFSLTAVSAFFADYGEKRPKSSPTSVEFIVPNAVKSIFKQFYKSKFETEHTQNID